MNKFYFILAAFVFTATSFAQVDLVKQQAEINSAKANLEDARQKRDMIVAKRWQEKAKQNEERERVDEQLEAKKEKSEAILSERSRLFEELRIAREALDYANEDAEKARTEFAASFVSQDRINELQAVSRGAIPFAIPEVSISGLTDSPLQAVNVLFELAKKDIAYASEIEKTDSIIRLGGVGALKNGADSNGIAMLLPIDTEHGRIFSWQNNLQPEIKKEIQAAFSANDSLPYLLVPVDPLLSSTLSKEILSKTEKTLTENFKQLLQDGGILMYPIIAMFIIALILILERIVVLILNRKVYKQIENIVNNPEIKTKEEASKEIEILFARVVPRLESKLSAISILGTTAPLLGLLGTVMGMIELFEVITVHGTADPKLLAGGISIALITTEAGLSVAIPVHLLHTWIAGRVEKTINKMDFIAMSLINKKFKS